MAQADGPAVFDRAHRHAAFILHGDVFVVDLTSGRRVQVTRTPQDESSPQFSADGRALQFRDGNDWYSYDLASGVTAPAAVLKFADDPQAKQPDALGERQLDLFKTLREIKADKQAQRDRTRRWRPPIPGRAPQPFWLGDKFAPVDTELSPDGRWLLLVTAPKDYTRARHRRSTITSPTAATPSRRRRAPMSVATTRRRSRCCCWTCAHTSSTR